MNKYLKNFARYAFRLELLQHYDVENGRESFKRFLETSSISLKDNADWHELIKAVRRRNAFIQRVLVVKIPISDYLKYEIGHFDINE